MVKVQYLGHSCFQIESGEHKIIIDPFLTGNPLAAAKWEDIDAKFIVVTHAHGDHLGDSFNIAKANKSLIISVNELANYANAEAAKYGEGSFSAHNMHIGGAYDFPFGRVKLTIAHHGSANNEGAYMGEPAGVILTIDGKKIYHAGDTGLFMDMKLIGEIDDIDLFMVPIGGNFTMGIDDAVKAVEMVNPKLSVPMHYNTFPVIQADPDEFANKVKAIGKQAMVPKPGDSFEI